MSATAAERAAAVAQFQAWANEDRLAACTGLRTYCELDDDDAKDRAEYEALTPNQTELYDEMGQQGGTHLECMLYASIMDLSDRLYGKLTPQWCCFEPDPQPDDFSLDGRVHCTACGREWDGEQYARYPRNGGWA